MASSDSLQQAQVLRLCEICNEDNIKWRCIDCEMCLCEKCQICHLRVPATAKHQIVTIATSILSVQRRIVTDNIPCKDHVTKMSCMFCQTCDSLLCPECVATLHRKHEFVPIENILGNKLEQLKGMQAKVDSSLEFCESKIAETQNVMSQYNDIFDESVIKIKQKEQDLKEKITKFSKDSQDKVEVQRSKVKKERTKVDKQIEVAKKNLEVLKEELEIAVNSNQGQIIFETTLNEPILKFDSISNKAEIFIPQREISIQMKSLFGSFQEVTIPSILPRLRIENVRKCTNTDLSVIRNVLPLDDTTAWMKCYKKYDSHHGHSMLRKVTVKDSNLIILSELTLEINDMSLTTDNDILLTESNKCDIKLMTNSGEIKSFTSVKPLLPHGIHVTKQKVIVGVSEPGDIYTPNNQSQRAVLVFGMDKKEKQRYQYDGNRKGLFTYPYRITVNKNQDILVVDLTSKRSGRVVTLDSEGNIKWIYEGHPKINDTIKFTPTGIATTSAGYNIVSDRLAHALHVLSENGDVLTCKVIDDEKIMYPWGLNIDRWGVMWVGYDNGKDSGAELHIVKLLI